MGKVSFSSFGRVCFKKKRKKKNHTTNQQTNKNLRKSPNYFLSDFQAFQMEGRCVNLDSIFCLSSYGLDDIPLFELFIQLCSNTCKNFSCSNLTYIKERSFPKIRETPFPSFFNPKSVLPNLQLKLGTSFSFQVFPELPWRSTSKTSGIEILINFAIYLNLK